MNIATSKMRWFSRTPQGWYERFNVKFNEQEADAINNNHENTHQLWQQFHEISSTKIEPPQNVQQIFLINYDPHSELIIANINDQGHGYIIAKKHDQYYRKPF